jgi:protein-S-isoprenylcysteine O-methyltransferase Ste14
LVIGRFRACVFLVPITAGPVVKSNPEEKLMLQTFPGTYPAYRSRVKALIPGIL